MNKGTRFEFYVRNVKRLLSHRFGFYSRLQGCSLCAAVYFCWQPANAVGERHIFTRESDHSLGVSSWQLLGNLAINTCCFLVIYLLRWKQ